MIGLPFGYRREGEVTIFVNWAIFWGVTEEDLLKNEAEGSLYRLEEALDSSGDLLELRKVKYFYLQVNFFFNRK